MASNLIAMALQPNSNYVLAFHSLAYFAPKVPGQTRSSSAVGGENSAGVGDWAVVLARMGMVVLVCKVEVKVGQLELCPGVTRSDSH